MWPGRNVMDNCYTLLDHTADLRVRIVGCDLADLFKNAGLALFDLITQPGGMESPTLVEIDVNGTDRADLMVNFLRELLYLWTGSELLVSTIDIQQISDSAVCARVSTDRYQTERNLIRHEIKAVTYHQIDVSQTKTGWQATVVFDV